MLDADAVLATIARLRAAARDGASGAAAAGPRGARRPRDGAQLVFGAAPTAGFLVANLRAFFTNLWTCRE